jgi:hypothetical protein
MPRGKGRFQIRSTSENALVRRVTEERGPKKEQREGKVWEERGFLQDKVCSVR